MWDHRPERAAALASTRQTGYLPGVRLPDGIHVTADLARAWSAADTVVLAVPSHALRSVARRCARLPARPGQILVNAAKGLELESGLRPSQVLRQEVPHPPGHIVSLVGPSHAEEVARGMPTTVVYVLLAALVVAGAGVVTLVEKMPFGDTLYFAFVTGLTIGYGDIVVKTPDTLEEIP